ncbi:hypothetical protein D8Y22_05180 [Salinadaptatus halalkaliphilus]|uniref:DUF8135 domain-containing protein n=1 Tax=Salinadaptatus halalkaliphilus TaxID=2419781 RepID=A0A4V3VLJ9_9EURY|nr:hypothetical protein [Salinadaptatus halalkaliphilus]THE65917.1 hypothetical protein D8Y22_05180 [Salinadaptatus halalkaliphilus]
MTDRDTEATDRPIDDPDETIDDDSHDADRSIGPADETDIDTDDDRVSPAEPAVPLGELAARVDDDGATASSSARSTTDDVDELFDQEPVTEIDSDRLWERLEDGTSVPIGETDREIREIDAQNYCHQCEHFAKPPTVACTREDTDIIELAALGTFRVADCPIVLEDEALEDDRH